MDKHVQELADKINDLKKKLHATNEEIDNCKTVEDFVAIRDKRANLIYHLDITKERYSKKYKKLKTYTPLKK